MKHNLISEYSHILHFSWVKHMALSHTSCRQLRPKTCILWWMWKIFMAHSMYLKMVPWTRLAPAPPSPEQPLHGVPLYASIPYTLFNWWLTYLVWIKLQLNVWIILKHDYYWFQVIENCPVTGVQVKVDDFGVKRVKAVETAHGTIQTPCVVNCAGQKDAGFTSRGQSGIVKWHLTTCCCKRKLFDQCQSPLILLNDPFW